MDALPPQKFQPRQWRFGRKRRRSGTEATESEGKNKLHPFAITIENLMHRWFDRLSSSVGDSKLVKKEDGEEMETTVTAPSAPVVAVIANGTPAKVTGNEPRQGPWQIIVFIWSYPLKIKCQNIFSIFEKSNPNHISHVENRIFWDLIFTG